MKDYLGATRYRGAVLGTKKCSPETDQDTYGRRKGNGSRTREILKGARSTNSEAA